MELTIRKEFGGFNFLSVAKENFGLAGWDLPHPELGIFGAGEQHVGAVMPKHALEKKKLKALTFCLPT
jgi:hypothetical protein